MHIRIQLGTPNPKRLNPQHGSSPGAHFTPLLWRLGWLLLLPGLVQAQDAVSNRGQSPLPSSQARAAWVADESTASAPLTQDVEVLSFSDILPFETTIGMPTTHIGFADQPVNTIILNQYSGLGVTFSDGNDKVTYNTGFQQDGYGLYGGTTVSLSFSKPINVLSTYYAGAQTIKLYDQPGGTLLYTSPNFGSTGLNLFAGVFSYTPFTYAVITDWVDSKTNIDDIMFGMAADADHDGYAAGKDCNDQDATIRPGLGELCDGLDNNCNGQVDEGVQRTLYPDADGDGFGAEALPAQACGIPAGYAENNKDCDDTNASVNLAAPEVCDGLDNNCNGSIDEGVQEIIYMDADQDGFGDEDAWTEACAPTYPFVADGGDCDDANSGVNPEMPELATDCDDGLDQDCNGEDLSCAEADQDGDGISSLSGDCNDLNSTVYPGASELCDGLDNNCNRQIDELDQDKDGYTTIACHGSDCDDANPTVHPNATEIPGDGLDNDCVAATSDEPPTPTPSPSPMPTLTPAPTLAPTPTQAPTPTGTPAQTPNVTETPQPPTDANSSTPLPDLETPETTQAPVETPDAATPTPAEPAPVTPTTSPEPPSPGPSEPPQQTSPTPSGAVQAVTAVVGGGLSCSVTPEFRRSAPSVPPSAGATVLLFLTLGLVVTRRRGAPPRP